MQAAGIRAKRAGITTAEVFEMQDKAA